MESLAAPLIPLHEFLHLWYTSLSSLCGLAVASLHRVEVYTYEWTLRWVFACSLFCFACTSHAVSPRPGLVKLLALSNFPAYVHVTRVSQDITACVVFIVIPYCHRCFLLLDRMRSLVTGISNLMASLRRSSFILCTIDDATPERLSRLWRTLPRRINLFRICLINSFHCFGQWRECFCCFSRTGIVLFALL